MAKRARADSFKRVKEIGRTLPDVELTTTWGKPTLKVRGKMFVCIASHKSAEPDTLVVRISVDQRDAMIADDPDTYYLKPHYEDYACVLVRLARIRRDALRDLMQAGWRFVDATVPPRRSTPRRR